jgi:6-phosphogluconate dehydrogenase
MMNLGMIGAGRMGAGMVRRLLAQGHACFVFDRSPESLKPLAAAGAKTFDSLAALVQALPQPRALWAMVPSGAPTQATLDELKGLLSPGDFVIDGGNSHYKDSARHGLELSAKGLHFVDCGTSGGVWGEKRGYCLMVGGEPDSFKALEPLFRSLAPGQGTIEPSAGREKRASTAEQGYLYCGPAGSGHFVKMIHNGIEYGLMQAYAEGFELMRQRGSEEVEAATRYKGLPLADIAELWRRGSVVSSWLLDLTALALAEDEGLARFQGKVPDSGEGRWSLEAAIEESVAAPVLSAALFARFSSRQEAAYSNKLLSAMREKFGGHHEAAPPQA